MGSRTVHEIAEYFDSYVVDMEQCLERDPENWASYLKDPRPFVTDLLGDFGHFPADASFDEIDAEIKQAVNRWWRPV